MDSYCSAGHLRAFLAGRQSRDLAIWSWLRHFIASPHFHRFIDSWGSFCVSEARMPRKLSSQCLPVNTYAEVLGRKVGDWRITTKGGVVNGHVRLCP